MDKIIFGFWLYQSFASFGKRSGVNFMAACIFPFIFIFPCMNAVWGLRVPANNATASSSTREKVAFGVPFFPFVTDPDPFLRSIVQTVGA
jgi:hypothetical protein